MTETVLDGGALAPAEPVGAPIPESNPAPPNPLGSQTPVAEKPEVKPEAPKTAGDAVRTAMEKVKERQATEAKAKEAPQPEVKPETKAPEQKVEAKQPDQQKPAPERAPDGKFLGKEPAQVQTPQAPQPGTIHEAPQRIDAAAKADWGNVPESVKGAVHRTFREMEAGLEEHRQRWEPIKQYDDMARQYGTDLPAALERYVAMDKLLSEDLAQGLDSIIRDKTGNRLGLHDLIGQMTGQEPDQRQSQADSRVHELTETVNGLVRHMQQQTTRTIETDVVSFSQGKEDFEALAPQIAAHIRAGKDLPTAYQTAREEAEAVARSLGFVPANMQQPLSPAPTPLKPAGQKSISGAPSTGSDPASVKKAPASSIREALERARAQVA